MNALKVNSVESFCPFIKRGSPKFDEPKDETTCLHPKKNRWRFKDRHDTVREVVLGGSREDAL